MGPAARTAIASVAGAIAAVGGAHLAAVAELALRPLELGLPVVPVRVDAVRFLGPHGLRAIGVGLALGPLVALACTSAIDRPRWRGFLGVVLAAGGLATLVVAVVQARAVAGAAATSVAVELREVGVGLGAVVATGLGLAIAERDTIGRPVGRGLRSVAVAIPIAVVLAIGWKSVAGALL